MRESRGDPEGKSSQGLVNGERVFISDGGKKAWLLSDRKAGGNNN